MLQKCDAEYDKFVIEHPLIDVVSSVVTSWQTQDIICLKCGQTKSTNLSPTCGCGGAFRPSLNRGELTNKLKMIQSGEPDPNPRVRTAS